jgi:hypothetical protein
MAANLKELEFRERLEQISTDGTIITRRLWCAPYAARPIVYGTLLGAAYDNDAKQPVRLVPHVDPILSYCYCTEVTADPIRQDAISASPTTGFRGTTSQTDTRDMVMNALNQWEVADGPTAAYAGAVSSSSGIPNLPAGCFLTAIYKPLHTCWTPISQADNDIARDFDYCDPQFEIAGKTVDVNKSLGILLNVGGLAGNGPRAAAVGRVFRKMAGFTSWEPSNAFVPEGYVQFSMQRRLCSRVNWDTISKLLNTVNLDSDWIPTFNIPMLPVVGDGDNRRCFPQGTIRFDGVDVQKRIIPTCWTPQGTLIYNTDAAHTDQPNQVACVPCVYYDITYHFTWRLIWDTWYDFDNQFTSGGLVPWDCIPCAPAILNTLGATFGYYQAGWSKNKVETWKGNFRSVYRAAEQVYTPTIASKMNPNAHIFEDLFYDP